MKNQPNSKPPSLEEIDARFRGGSAPQGVCDDLVAYDLSNGVALEDGPSDEVKRLLAEWKEASGEDLTPDLEAARNRAMKVKPVPVGDPATFFQRWRNSKNLYLTSAAYAALDDTRDRLPPEYLKEATEALQATGKPFPKHNIASLAWALYYADNGFYVVDGHGFDANGKGTAPNGDAKVPRGAKWQERATTDREEVIAFWTGDGYYPPNDDGKSYPYASPDKPRNVCIVFPENCGYFVLDIDGEKGKRSLAKLEAENGPLPKTLKSLSGSGNGCHLIYKDGGMDIRNTASAIADGVDIRALNGQVVAEPSAHKSGGFYRWVDGCAPGEREVAEAPEWLRDLSFKATKGRNDQPKRAKTKPKAKRKKASGAHRADGEWQMLLESIGDGDNQKGFHNPIRDVGNAYFRQFGVDADDAPLKVALRAAIDAAERDPDGGRERYDTDEYLDGRLEDSREFVASEEKHTGVPNSSYDVSDPLGDTLEDALATLDKNHIFVNHSGKNAIIRRRDPARPDDSVLEDWKLSDFKTFYADRCVPVEDDEGNVEIVNPAEVWIKRAKRHSRVVFLPPPSPNIGEHDFNIWDEFVPPDGDPSIGCERFKDFLLNVICRGRGPLFEWAWMWMAHMMQRPGEKPGTALVLQGNGGSGKSTLGELLRALLGSFAVHASTPDHVTGKHNKHQAFALLLVSDEAIFGGDPSVMGIIKDKVTSTTQRIEPKFIDSFEVRSCLRTIWIGNPKKVIPIEANGSDRRYLCMTVSDERIGDSKYFEALREEMENGGLAALYKELSEYDPASAGLTWSDVRVAPVTPERLLMRGLTLRPVVRAMMDIIEDGVMNLRDESNRALRYTFNEDAETNVVKAHLRAALSRYANAKDSRDAASEVLDELFGESVVRTSKRKTFFGVVHPDETASDGVQEDFQKDANCYVFPPLSELRAILQERFDAAKELDE